MLGCFKNYAYLYGKFTAMFELVFLTGVFVWIIYIFMKELIPRSERKDYISLSDLKFPDLETTKDKDVIWHIKFSEKDFVEFWWKNISKETKSKLSKEVRTAFEEKVFRARKWTDMDLSKKLYPGMQTYLLPYVETADEWDILSHIKRFEKHHIEYWWESISDEAKANLSETVRNAFLEKIGLSEKNTNLDLQTGS